MLMRLQSIGSRPPDLYLVQVLASALQQPSSRNKVVEIVASPSAKVLPEDKWFP